MTPQTSPALPATDSIRELAEFWDAHSLTDFDDELEEVAGLVFARDDEPVTIPLRPSEAEAVAGLAASEDTSREELLRRWVLRALAERGEAS